MTKAKTAAAKLRAKRARGRPCKPDVARNDNGRISQARMPGEAPDVLARRKRVELYGISMKDAGIVEHGTVIGRLYKSQEITENQYIVLEKYGKVVQRYFSSISAPDSLKSKGSGVTIPDDESDARLAQQWLDIRKKVMEAQVSERSNLFAALQFFVTKDEFHEHMLGDVRVAANVLVRYYGL